MSAYAAAAAKEGTISGRAATAIIGGNYYQLLRLAAAGVIRTDALPGHTMRFVLEDVEAEARRRGRLLEARGDSQE